MVVTEKLIQQRLEKLPHRSAGYKQLIRELGLRGAERRELEDKLAEMVARGKLVLTGRDRYSLPAEAADRNLVVGRLSVHRDGYGFVTPEDRETRERLGGDVFINPPEIGSAMHDDQVLVELKGGPRDGRAEATPASQKQACRGPRLEGRILRIMSRAQTTVVGVFHYGNRFNFVHPMDERITADIVIPRGLERPPATPSDPAKAPDASRVPEANEAARELISTRGSWQTAAGPPPSAGFALGGVRDRVIGSEARRRQWTDLEGLVVEVEITHWPTASESTKGRVVEILGYEDDFGVDVEIVIRKHHLPHRFPLPALAQAQEVEAIIPQRELRRRRDFRALPIVTIDGETARDFDDAVTVSRLDNGNYELQVHIADVAHYVAEDSAIDHEARWRGTSVYFPDRAIPMLPVELSTEVCTLRPHADRLVMSCVMEIDRRGEIAGYQLCPGVMRSAERMTYTDVALVLDGDAGARQRYAPLVEVFELMEEVALVLAEKRERRGSIDFDLPEPVIEFDEHGLMRGVTRSERNMAHRIIEEFMLAANESVASYLETKGVASLYRVHHKPDARRVLEFETLAASFGYSLGVGALPVDRFRPRSERRASYGTGRQPREVEVPRDVHITPRMYQKLTSKLEGKPEERILSYLMLRSLTQARYSEINEGHFALAASTYTHFTSPIRRYPDLTVHRILKAVLAESAEQSEEGISIGVGGPVVQNYSAKALAEAKAATQQAQTPRSPYLKPPLKGRDGGRHASRHDEGATGQDGAAGALGPMPPDVLHEIAGDTSFTERRADEAERELLEWKKVKFMQERLGEEFDGLVVSVTKFGLFVELNDLFIEGLVPLVTLSDDRYTYHENTRQLIGQRGRRTFSIGDRVRVLVDRIDPVQHKIQFALIEPEPSRAERRHRKT
jgi:ribonuclease R